MEIKESSNPIPQENDNQLPQDNDIQLPQDNEIQVPQDNDIHVPQDNDIQVPQDNEIQVPQDNSTPVMQDNGKLVPPDKRVTEFIQEHHLATLTVCDGADMWSWHAFYHFSPQEMLFVITSEDKTRHIQIFRRGASNIVSGAIGLETETIGLIRGVQFRANMEQCDGPFLNNYRLSYLKRFPYAILKGGDLWLLKICELKFTDNRLGFGKKIIWKRGEPCQG